MRAELTQIGVTEMRTADEVDATLKKSQGRRSCSELICGCAARNARPAVAKAIKGDVKPDALTTVFAGQDIEAVQRARSYFTGYAPSSPQIALLKDGKVVYMLERHQIEGRSSDEIATDLTRAFEKFCEARTAA